MSAIIPADKEFGWPSLDVNPSKILAITEYLSGRVAYLWDGKADPVNVDESTLTGLDCSGFTRVAIFHALMATGAISGPGEFEIPDGSEAQHAWLASKGFKVSTSPGAKDGELRWFILPPIGQEPGHTGFIVDGLTCESYGGHGVGRRPWTGEGWQAKCIVYVITAPGA